MGIKEKALIWWAEQTKKDKYVISTNEIPDRRQREYLVKKGYLFQLVRRHWALKRPEEQADEVFPLIYWQAVEKILSPFIWSLRGPSALTIHNGNQMAQKQLQVRTKEKTNWKITLPLGFNINLQFDPGFDERLVRKIDVAGRKIPVDIPERLLADVSRLDSKDILSFVAGTKFDYRVLDAIYANNPRPVIFKRLIKFASDANRQDLTTRLEKIIEDHTYYQIIRKRAGKASAEEKTVITSPPWVIRHKAQFKEFESALEKALKSKIVRIKKYSLKQLLTQAREYKKYDTYHSTTLEGYRITPEEVEALLSGQVPENEKAEGAEYFEKLQNRMAIVGYSEAFDFILRRAESDFSKTQVSEDFIKDTYYNLFKPSADRGIVDYLSLTTYRNLPAFIRGTRYVPPSFEKLSDLMFSYTESVNRIQNPVIKSILAHYFFVVIHPYTDGNGRTARLIMNYIFLTSGFSWVTIKAEQRAEYFSALNKGTVYEDIMPFGEFIVKMMKEASKNP